MATPHPKYPTVPGLPPVLASHPRYRILRELGRGGMGVVYQARQTVMDRPVVIKVVSKALLDQPDAVERFHREVRAAARLSHPNIVTAYDAEQAGESHMLVMEFVPGQTLAEVLRRHGPLAVAHACHFVRQAALGLQHAHEQGMVHRDIKPQNLMLTPKGQVKVLDFGLAKLASERGSRAGLTSDGAYMGTPEYCAPEQATDARSADIRADIYSLGCTLYCLLAGRPPFEADTPVQAALAHLMQEPPPLPGLRPDVPPELWQAVARMLAKDPAKRYQAPAEVARALVRFSGRGGKGPVPPAAPTPAGGPAPVVATVAPGDTRAINPRQAEARPPARGKVDPAAGMPVAGAVPAGRAGRGDRRSSARWPWLVVGAGGTVLLLGAVVVLRSGWPGRGGAELRPEAGAGLVVTESTQATKPEPARPAASPPPTAGAPAPRPSAAPPAKPLEPPPSRAVALRQIRSQEKLNELLAALHDKDPEVREASAFALGEIGLPSRPDAAQTAFRDLLGALADPDARVRQSAAHALGKYGPPAALAAPGLRTCLLDNDPAVRQNAAWALGQLAPAVEPATVAGLGQRLAEDADPRVRRAAALALGKCGRDARPALRNLLAQSRRDADAAGRRAARGTLVGVVGPEDTDLTADLREALHSPDADVVRDAAFALANIGGAAAEDAVPVLRQALQDRDPPTRRLAATALANIGPHAGAAVADLTAALADPDAEVRRSAAVGLGRLGTAAAGARPALTGLLADPAQPEEVRKYAAEALADIDPNHPEVVAALLKVLGEKGNYPVRHRAVWTLARLKEINQPAVVEALTKTLAETAPEARLLRYEAATTLAAGLGPRTPDKALDVLLEALKDSEVKIYQGTGTKVSSTGSGAGAGEAQVKEQGAGDWRRAVALALARVGRRANRPDIRAALRKVQEGSFDPEARKAAGLALEALGK